MAIIESYLDRLKSKLDAFPDDGVLDLAQHLLKTRANGGTVFVIGNGGSSATASHAANDWMIGSGLEKPSLRVICLSESVSQISAIGNDDQFSNIFSRPLNLLAAPGDLLVAFSASGNSENILNALKAADAIGVNTFGVLGFDGGKAMGLSDSYILFESDHGEYGVVEDLHLTTVHLVKDALIAHRVGQA